MFRKKERVKCDTDSNVVRKGDCFISVLYNELFEQL